MEKNLEATSFDANKNLSTEADVDALIAGALKEIGTKPEQKAGEEKVLRATPMAAPAPMKVQSPKLAASEVEPSPAPVLAAPISPVVKIEEKKLETAGPYEDSFKNFTVGAMITGVVAKVEPSGALIDIGYKSDGWLPRDEIRGEIKVGEKIKVMIEKLESKEGYALLSKKNADVESAWNEAYDAYKSRKMIEAKVTGAVQGGLVVDFGGIRGFIPASQVDKSPESSLEEFVNKILPVKIIEINMRQGKVIFSHKMGSVEKEKEEAGKIIDELETGQVRPGVVRSLKNFGAFVDLGGIEGLIHLTELSWKRVKHPSDVLKVGQKLDVFVLGVDRVSKKVSLGLKELQPDPWAAGIQKYKQGQIVKVKILRIAKFGAFAELEEGLEGLIHISELSKDKIEKPEDAVKPGDIVEARILRIIPEEQKIGLSIRDAQLQKEKTAAIEQKKEESKVTIGEMIAEKERAKEEREAEFEQPVE